MGLPSLSAVGVDQHALWMSPSCRPRGSGPRRRCVLPSPSIHPPPYSKQEAILVAYEQLGGFAAVAHHVPVEAINQIEDVSVLDQLAAEPGGDDMIRTLEAVAASESLRSAAKILHLHHN